MKVTNSAGSVESNAATLIVNGGGDFAPVIVIQPTNQPVVVGEKATFTVRATGTEPLSYQWKKNGTAIPSATAASYTTPVTALTDSGASFTVIVSNPFGTATSNPAILTVTDRPIPPTITQHPANTQVNEGGTVTFNVEATGVPAPTYQWYKNSAPINGQISRVLTLANVPYSDNGSTYYAVAKNSAGEARSNEATLTVIKDTGVLPTITTQPANQTADEVKTATFTVVATGTAPLSYQWKKNGVNIDNATSASYTTPATTMADNGASFTVTVTNPRDSVESDDATLTVIPVINPPKIVTQPVSQTVNDGDTATFSVVATERGLSYQWSKNGKDIAGATSASHTTPATVYANDNKAQFVVTVTNVQGKAVSDPAILTVMQKNDPPVITTQPADQTVKVGATATFSVAATGTAPLSYQWQKNGTAIVGATNASHTTPAVTAADNNAVFKVTVKNAAGEVLSNAATLKVETSTHTVKFVAGSNGTINGTDTQSVANGASTTPVTAVANSGYAFSNWTGANFTTSTSNPLTIANVTSDMSITANFVVDDAPPVGFKVGNTATDVSGVDQSGAQVKLSDYKGNVILMVISSVWCSPCNAEAPVIEKQYQQVYKDRGLKVMTDLVEDDSGPSTQQTCQDWATKYKLTHRVQTDPSEIGYKYASSIPRLVIIDKKFVIRYNGSDGASPKTMIEKCLAE